MLIVLPSDPATTEAAEYLTTRGIAHQLIPIPDDLGYKTGANMAIYLQAEDPDTVMLDLSAQGMVIMRVFKNFELC